MIWEGKGAPGVESLEGVIPPPRWTWNVGGDKVVPPPVFYACQHVCMWGARFYHFGHSWFIVVVFVARLITNYMTWPPFRCSEEDSLFRSLLKAFFAFLTLSLTRNLFCRSGFTWCFWNWPLHIFSSSSSSFLWHLESWADSVCQLTSCQR